MISKRVFRAGAAFSGHLNSPNSLTAAAGACFDNCQHHCDSRAAQQGCPAACTTLPPSSPRVMSSAKSKSRHGTLTGVFNGAFGGVTTGDVLLTPSGKVNITINGIKLQAWKRAKETIEAAVRREIAEYLDTKFERLVMESESDESESEDEVAPLPAAQPVLTTPRLRNTDKKYSPTKTLRPGELKRLQGGQATGRRRTGSPKAVSMTPDTLTELCHAILPPDQFEALEPTLKKSIDMLGATVETVDEMGYDRCSSASNLDAPSNRALHRRGSTPSTRRGHRRDPALSRRLRPRRRRTLARVVVPLILRVLEIAKAGTSDRGGVYRLIAADRAIQSFVLEEDAPRNEAPPVLIAIADAYRIAMKTKDNKSALQLLSLLAPYMLDNDIIDLCSDNVDIRPGVHVRVLKPGGRGHQYRRAVILSGNAEDGFKVQYYESSEAVQKARFATKAQGAAAVAADGDATQLETEDNVPRDRIKVSDAVYCTRRQCWLARIHAARHYPGALPVNETWTRTRLYGKRAEMLARALRPGGGEIVLADASNRNAARGVKYLRTDTRKALWRRLVGEMEEAGLKPIDWRDYRRHANDGTTIDQTVEHRVEIRPAPPRVRAGRPKV